MDYHIYLHNLNEGGQGNPTVPTPPDKPSMTAPDYSEGGGFNPRMALSTAAKAAKGFLPVAVALAAAKMADKALTVSLPLMAKENGDYSGAIAYSNFKAQLNNMTHPVSTALNWVKAEQDIRLSNVRSQRQRELLGDAFLSSIGRKV